MQKRVDQPTVAPPQPAQAGTDPGFKVPAAGAPAAGAPAAGTPAAGAPAAGSPAAASSGAAASAGAPVEIASMPDVPATDTSARELAIGGAVFLVLMLVFFFVRNAYTHHLVVRRVAPSTAGSAGWLLFVGLSFLSAAAVLAIVNASRFLTLAITGPLLLVAVAALIGALLVGRR
ncbi:MAG: hypothetical protein V4754_19215 [Pseudomonadota bacterium]